jgi:hypothetical protein
MSVAALLATGILAAPNVSSAAPLADALAITKATDTNVETVRWRRGFGWGAGAGLLGGAILGGALAAPYYDEPYYREPYYDAPAVYGGEYPALGNDAFYCARRFRSYDPATGTYLGYDGLRHSCP